VWSAATAACGLVRSYAGLFLARTGVGVGEAALSPSAYSSIADSFHPERRGRAMGVYSVGSYLGSGLAFLLGGYVLAFIGEQGPKELPFLGPTPPWKVVFLVLGIPGLLLVPLFATIPEPLRRRTGTSASRAPSIAQHMRANGVRTSHNLASAARAPATARACGRPRSSSAITDERRRSGSPRWIADRQDIDRLRQVAQRSPARARQDRRDDAVGLTAVV
jgi:MFS family permease